MQKAASWLHKATSCVTARLKPWSTSEANWIFEEGDFERDRSLTGLELDSSSAHQHGYSLKRSPRAREWVLPGARKHTLGSLNWLADTEKSFADFQKTK